MAIQIRPTYGKEVIIDIHDCDPNTFNRDSIKTYFIGACKLLDMIPEDQHFWDYEGQEELKDVDPDHVVGTSAIQFIRTSNITIHTLDRLRRVYLNIFSCKDFEMTEIVKFSKDWFNGVVINIEEIERV